MLTIQQIAEELRMSPTTVSRAISGKGRISEKTRATVKAYIDSVGYQPNAIAQGLAQSRSSSLALVIPRDLNASRSFFFYECILGVCEAAEAAGYDIIVVTVDADSHSSYEHLIQKRKIDGLILTRLYDDDMAVNHLLCTGFPFLVIGEVEDERITKVCNNYREASLVLTSHLLDSGSKRILFIEGDSKHKIVQNRCAGFVEAFQLLKNKSAEFSILRNMRSETDIAEQLSPAIDSFHPDAIVASDDVLCEWTLSILQNMKLRIPEDIRIASCIDSDSMRRHIPAITAIDIHTPLLAKAAAEVLIQRLEGEIFQQQTILPYSVLLRSSTEIIREME